jgi:hypothetical protein
MLADDALTCPATHNGDCHAAGDHDKCMLMTGDRVRRKHKAAVKLRVRIPRNRRVDIVLAVTSQHGRPWLGAKYCAFAAIFTHAEHDDAAPIVRKRDSGFG